MIINNFLTEKIKNTNDKNDNNQTIHNMQKWKLYCNKFHIIVVS
jgi:hypothetical protein